MMMFLLWLLVFLVFPGVFCLTVCLLVNAGSLSPSGLPEHLITCIWSDCRHTCHPSAHHPSSASSPTDGTSSPAASITCPARPDSAIFQSSSTFVIHSPSFPSSLCFGNKSLKPHIGHQATESFWAPLLKHFWTFASGNLQ